MIVAIQANIASIHSTPNSLIEVMRCCALCRAHSLSLFSIFLNCFGREKIPLPICCCDCCCWFLSFIGHIFICIFHLFVHCMHDRVFSPSHTLSLSPLLFAHRLFLILFASTLSAHWDHFNVVLWSISYCLCVCIVKHMIVINGSVVQFFPFNWSWKCAVCFCLRASKFKLQNLSHYHR